MRIGQPRLNEAPLAQKTEPPAEKPQPAMPSGGARPEQPVAIPQAAAQPELQAALAELASAPTQPYYDAEADAQDRSSYYAGLPADKDPDEFYQALHALLSTTATHIAKYAPGRHLYPWVDLHRDIRLRSIYSNREYDPAELIRDDFHVLEQRAARINEIMLAEAALGREELMAEFDALEVALPYNCEHAVCQSWFAGEEPMRGDLHHLFACEMGCNSFRGNAPYFDFPDFLEVVRGECGKLENERFEPENGKGKVARATLYFLLCYPSKVNSVMRIYDETRLKTLLAWHVQFPVTDHEKHRNRAIFQRQGNRNPLIDFPAWASRINFALGL